MKLTIDDVRSRFIEHFDGTTGSVYASPGRINLIGEHTDYNDGFVFPGAVQQSKRDKKCTCLLYRLERLRGVFFRR